jgi:hypothetical protein
VAGRKGFQKIYDLAERIIPAGTDTRLPSKEEYAGYLIRTSLRAHGLASVKDMTHLRRGMQPYVTKALKKMLVEGEIEKIIVEGCSEDFFIGAEGRSLLRSKNSLPGSTVFLSPFDNAIIRRDRVMDLFNYDFAIECYLPEPKRKFGYFCLPVLHNGAFIGRFDPRADRETKTFIVKSLHIEHPPKNMDVFVASFAAALREFAAFNGCEKIVLEKVYPAKNKAALQALLK